MRHLILHARQRPHPLAHAPSALRNFHFILSCDIKELMVQRSSRYLQAVRRILFKRLQRYDVKVYLFGSITRDELRRTSDIDVAVLPMGSLPDVVLSEIREELDNSRVPYRVELIDLAKVSPRFASHVQRVGTPWND